MADEEMIVEIPSDLIALGHDADGLPKTVLAEDPAPVEKVEEAKPEPKFSDEDYTRAQRQAEEARVAADAARKEAEEARAARNRAEDESATKDLAVLRSHYTAIAAEQGTIESSLANWDSAAELAKREMLIAREAGDASAEIEASRKMQRAESNISKLQDAQYRVKIELERAERALTAPPPEKPKREEAAPTPKQATADDWVKEVRGRAGEKIGDWFDKNREFITNPDLHKAAMAYISYQSARGKPINSDTFIKSLNKEFLEEETAMAEEEAKPEVAKAEPRVAPKPAARAPSAAPVSRNGSYFSSSNLNAAQVKLPPKLAAFVRASGLDPVKYALGAVEDIKAGKLPKNFLDPDYDHNF